MLQLSRYNEVKDYMSQFIIEVNESKTLSNPIAFILLRDSLVGECYKMYLNSADENFKKYLYMHECGHIIFNHVENADVKAASVSSRIRAKFNEYKEWFDNDEVFFEYIKKEIFNVIQDFEVNSKLFTREEFDAYCELGSKVTGSPMRGCWPEDYGFPVGKSWKEYLTYVLDDFEKFLNGEKSNLSKMVQQQQQQQSTRSKDKSEGDGNSDDPTKTERGNKIRNSRFTEDELNEMKKSVAENLPQNKEAKANEVNSESMARYGVAMSEAHEVDKSLSFDEVKKALLKNVFNKRLVLGRRDMMYNANRRKSPSSVLVPKDIQHEMHLAEDFYVILDVSGSVSSTLVNKTVAMFNELASRFGRKSRVIFWDENLVGDVLLKDVKYSYCGGGTEIAKGIKYVNEKYIKNNEKVFIISDFCDSLEEWADAIKKSHSSNFYGICWEPDADIRTVKRYFQDVYFLNVNA